MPMSMSICPCPCPWTWTWTGCDTRAPEKENWIPNESGLLPRILMGVFVLCGSCSGGYGLWNRFQGGCPYTTYIEGPRPLFFLVDESDKGRPHPFFCEARGPPSRDYLCDSAAAFHSEVRGNSSGVGVSGP